MRKLRKTGAVDQDGNVITIPRPPSVAGANKPVLRGTESLLTHRWREVDRTIGRSSEQTGGLAALT
jgi:hypothetical protein